MNNKLLAQATLDLAREANTQGLPGGDAVSAEAGFSQLLADFLGIAMTVGGIMLLIYLVWGAIEWITAGGDSGKVTNARNRITQGILGLIVLAATTTLFAVVQEFLGVCIIDIGGSCSNIGVI